MPIVVNERKRGLSGRARNGPAFLDKMVIHYTGFFDSFACVFCDDWKEFTGRKSSVLSL